MVTINLTPPNFVLSVGDLDVTSLVAQFSIRQAAIDIKNPIVWEGSVTLYRTKDWAGESLDDFANPTRWARGKHPVTLTIAGTLFATLRIGSYSYNEDEESAQMNLTQLLDLLNYKTPPEDYRFFALTNQNDPVTTLVADLLEAGGITTYDLSGYTGDAAIPAPDRTNRSYLELAQEILGERCFWLYHAPDETVKVIGIDFNATKSFERERPTILEYVRKNDRDIVPNVYRVLGGGERYTPPCEMNRVAAGIERIYDITPNRYGYWRNGVFEPLLTTYFLGVVEEIHTDIVRDDLNAIIIKKTGYRLLENRYNGGTSTYTLVKAYEIYEEQYYDNQGRMTKEVRRKDGTFIFNFPDLDYTNLVPGVAFSWIEKIEYNVIEYYANPNEYEGYEGTTRIQGQVFDGDVVRLKVDTSYKTLPIRTVFNDSFGTSVTYQMPVYPVERTIETWIEWCFQNKDANYIYEKKYYSRDPINYYAQNVHPNLFFRNGLYLISETNEYGENASPPSWNTRPPLHPRGVVKLDAEVRLSYPGSDDDLIDKREFEYNAQSITTDGEAYKLANFFAYLTVGRAFGYEVVLSLRESSEFLQDPTPLQTVWMHNRVFLLDSPSVVFDGTEAELSWETVTLSALSPAVGGEDPQPVPIWEPEGLFYIRRESPVIVTGTPRIITTLPDLSTIEVDGNGDVVTMNGYVQASQDENLFAHILVDELGRVVVDVAAGDVVTDHDDPYDPSFWGLISTVDGDVVTMDGEVLWIS